MSLSGWLKSLAFRRSEGLSCRPFDSAQDKLRPASIFACAARPKKTWIPAYAGMTTRKKSRLLVDEFRTPRLVAEVRTVVQFDFGSALRRRKDFSLRSK